MKKGSPKAAFSSAVILYIQQNQGCQNDAHGNQLTAAELFPEEKCAGQCDDDDGGYAAHGINDNGRYGLQRLEGKARTHEIGDADHHTEADLAQAGTFLLHQHDHRAEDKGRAEGKEEIGRAHV